VCRTSLREVISLSGVLARRVAGLLRSDVDLHIVRY
jgi:hypothetical protein